MKKKIPFSLEYRDKIESGEVQVVTKEGNNVRIICWDANAGDRPIVGLISIKGNYDQAYFYDETGNIPVDDDRNSLFLLVDEEELTEFEEAYLRIVHKLTPGDVLPNFYEISHLKENCKELLEVAERQLGKKFRIQSYQKGYERAKKEEEQQILKIHTDFVEAFLAIVNSWCKGDSRVYNEYNQQAKADAVTLLKLAKAQLRVEFNKELELAYKNQDGVVYKRGYEKGKEEALKDMPKWEKATEDLQIGCLVWDDQRHFHLYMDRVSKGELYISIADILRLPGSPKE